MLNVDDLRRRFSMGEMDYLYDNGINPNRFYPGKGIVIWGQKTQLGRPSDLEYLNVRLLLVVIEPAIKTALEDFLFDLNDATTRALARGMVNDYMEGIKARRGVYDFYTQCDEDNNLPTDIQNRIMNLHLYIKPTADVEYIPFTVVLTPYGMDFTLAKAAVGALGGK